MSKYSSNRRQRFSSKIRCAAALAAPAILSVSLFSSSARADLSWDSTSAGSASGGSGTWDVGSTWWNGTSDQAWADGNNAIFAGTAGTVTINASVAPTNLDFQTDGYYVQGGSLGATSVSVGSGLTAEINSTINGAGPLTMNGPGTLKLSGSNTYGGGTNFNGGVLQASSDGALGGYSNLTFNGGTLKFGAQLYSELRAHDRFERQWHLRHQREQRHWGRRNHRCRDFHQGRCRQLFGEHARYALDGQTGRPRGTLAVR